MIKPTTDIKKINSVLKHPFIWPRVSDKHQSKEEYTPPMDDVHYLYEDGVLFILHEVGGKLEIHANVIPESREKAEEAAREALRYGFDELGAIEIIAEIPEKYGEVYGFAVKFLKDVGFYDGNHHLALRVEEWAL